MLIAIIKKALHLDALMYTLPQVLSVLVFEKNQLSCALQRKPPVEANLDDGYELILFNS